MRTTFKRLVTGIAAFATAVLGSVALASPAWAAPITTGHYDLVMEATCDSSGKISGTSFHFENHNTGATVSNPEFKVPAAGPSLTLGFEVEWGAGCAKGPVNVNLTSPGTHTCSTPVGVGLFGAGSNFGGSCVAGLVTITAGVALPLNSGNTWHADPSTWTVTPTGAKFGLEFQFATSSGTFVSPLKYNLVGA